MSISSGRGFDIYSRLPVFLQDFAVTSAGARRWWHESAPRFQSLVSFLRRAESWTAGEAHEYRTDRLRAVLAAARETRRYGPLLASVSSTESDPWSVLSSMPVLDRDEVRRDPEAFLSRSWEGRLLRHGTSGTTGTPLQVYWTQESADIERALIWRHRLAHGCIPGRSWRGVLVGHRIVPPGRRKPPYWRVNLPERQIHLSTYHISPGTAGLYAAEIGRRGVRFLEGYPSVLYALAWSLEQAGSKLPLEAVFFGAEPMLGFQRDCVERVFSCRALDFYGLTERVVSASQFECGDWLHLNWENCVFEVVDSSGASVPEGETGELIGTSLGNLGFPLLRYRTGDMARLLPGTCSCGRRSPRMAPVDTKRESLLVMPDGSLLSASSLTYPFKSVRHISESQLVQKELGVLTVRLVPAEGYSEDDGRLLIRGLRECLPPSLDVRLEIVGSIPRTASGKFAFCISEIGCLSGDEPDSRRSGA